MSNLRLNKNQLITIPNILYKTLVLPYNNLTTGGPQWIPLTDPPSKGEVARTGAAPLVWPDWPTKDLKEGILLKEDQPKKDGVTGLESINGQVSVFLNTKLPNSLSRRVWRALYVVSGKWVIWRFLDADWYRYLRISKGAWGAYFKGVWQDY